MVARPRCEWSIATSPLSSRAPKSKGTKTHLVIGAARQMLCLICKIQFPIMKISEVWPWGFLGYRPTSGHTDRQTVILTTILRTPHVAVQNFLKTLGKGKGRYSRVYFHFMSFESVYGYWLDHWNLKCMDVTIHWPATNNTACMVTDKTHRFWLISVHNKQVYTVLVQTIQRYVRRSCLVQMLPLVCLFEYTQH